MARRAMLVVVAALLAAACGSGGSSNSSSSANPCAVSGAHHVYVEAIENGKVIAKGCYGFNGASADELTVMQHSGVEFATQKFSFGTAFCQIDRVPAHYSQCLPQSAPYWADWIWKNGSWSADQTGPEHTILADKQALAWVYTPQTGSPAPPPPPPAF